MKTQDTKIRIIDHSWHLAHQYSQISAIPDIEWTWLIQHRRGFNITPRGDFLEDFGVKQTPYYEKGKYDLAILHLDQQCLDEILYERGKGSLYRELNEVITDIPKLVIVHGTPYWPERFSPVELCDMMKKFIGKNFMLCNSHTARLQWAFGVEGAKIYKAAGKVETIGVPLKQSASLWHGIDPDDFPCLPKEPRIVTMVSPAGLDKYYDRLFLTTIKDMLKERNMHHCHITVDASFRNFKEYANFLGRSLIYFNPTRESPMPRARTEAMLAGCCVVTTPHQDASDFIEHGKNGFIIPRNPEKVTDFLEALVLEYKQALKVGEEGRKTALKLFRPERYRKEFLELINKIIKEYGE